MLPETLNPPRFAAPNVEDSRSTPTLESRSGYIPFRTLILGAGERPDSEYQSAFSGGIGAVQA